MSMHSNTSDCTAPCQTPPQLQLYQTIIFATPVLFACLLLVLFCLLYIRRRRDTFNAAQARAQFAARGFPSPVYEQGLSKSFRQKLPTVPFDVSREDNQCAVCLGEYQLNEKLQELPVCKHLFHVSCIDEWLAKNTTCPICRTSLNQEECNSLSLQRPEENRRWEERVLNEAQEGSIRLRLDARSEEESIGSSGSITGVPEMIFQFSGEHAINVERS